MNKKEEKKELEELFNEIEDNMRTPFIHWKSFLISADDWRRIRHKYLLTTHNKGK